MDKHRAQPDHAELMFALGAMHSDIKTAMGDIEELKNHTQDRLNGHSKRLGSLETTRTKMWAYAAGVSAGVFTVGTFIRDKLSI
jgi:hypothetical protein